MTKEIKIPMIVGIILYCVTIIIDLISVIIPGIAYDIMGSSFLKNQFNEFVLPSVTVFQTTGFIMLIAFYLIMLKYKGTEKRIVGIVMIVIFCVINIVQPYIGIVEKKFFSDLFGAEGLSALTTLESFISIFTHPFTLVSTVFVIIAIGRYGIIKRENNDISDIKAGTDK